MLAGEVTRSRKYFCMFCGEEFSNPSSVRYGVCLGSKDKKHVLSSCVSGSNLFCRFCGERFSNPTAVRFGICLHSKDRKHQLP